MGVELLIEAGGLPAYPPQTNSEYRMTCRGSQTTGDNLRGQKGNSPDRQIRPLNKPKLLR